MRSCGVLWILPRPFGDGLSSERCGAGEDPRTLQTEDVVDAVVLAPRHRLRPSIVPVATERNSRLVPSRADVRYKASKMGTQLDAARRLAGPQHDRHEPVRPIMGWRD